MTWGTGSKMQAVTGLPQDDSYDSLWMLKEEYGKAPIETGKLTIN